MTFDKNVKFEIGRAFLTSHASDPGFFMRGVTIACLWLVGRQPSCSDILHIRVMNGSNSVRNFFNIFVGMGPESRTSRGPSG